MASMVRSRRVVSTALILVSLVSGTARGQDAPAPPEEPPPETVPPPEAVPPQEKPLPPARHGTFQWWIAAGNFDADDNAGQLDDERGQFAFTTGLSYGFHPVLAVGFEFAAHTVDFDAPAVAPPFFGSIDDEYDLNAEGFILSLTAESPRGTIRPFAGAGLGLYRVTLSRFGSLFGFPGTAVEEQEFSPGLNLSAGLAIVLTPKAQLTFEYRRLFLEADFGTLTTGNVDVGGAMVLGGLRLVSRI